MTSPVDTTAAPQPATSAPPRGERLYPRRWQRLYWHLTCLRREIEQVIATEFAGPVSGTLVDYGCGNMPYRRLLESKVETYLGCDMPGNPEADLELSGAGTIPLADGMAQFVISSQVLEHVPDPVGYLQECRRVLQPGGRLILSTHGVWKYHPDPTDYWRWTSAGLQKIVTEAGFTVRNFRGVMAPPSYSLQILQDAMYERLPRWMRAPLCLVFQALIEVSDRVCSQRWRDRDACVFVVVAS